MKHVYSHCTLRISVWYEYISSQLDSKQPLLENNFFFFARFFGFNSEFLINSRHSICAQWKRTNKTRLRCRKSGRRHTKLIYSLIAFIYVFQNIRNYHRGVGVHMMFVQCGYTEDWLRLERINGNWLLEDKQEKQRRSAAVRCDSRTSHATCCARASTRSVYGFVFNTVARGRLLTTISLRFHHWVRITKRIQQVGSETCDRCVLLPVKKKCALKKLQGFGDAVPGHRHEWSQKKLRNWNERNKNKNHMKCATKRSER